MTRKLSLIFTVLLLLTACGKEEEPVYTPKPAISIAVDGFQGDGVVLSVKKINTEMVYALAVESAAEAPSSESIIENGYSEEDGKLIIRGLTPKTEYTVYAVGVNGSLCSSIVSVSLEMPYLYPWESSRSEIPFFADLDLLPGGVTNKTPNTWSEDRLKPHVTFTDENGTEKWLHEAFLFIGGVDDNAGTILCIPDGKEKSANQQSWKRFADYWIAEGAVTDVLDRTIANAISRIGKPSFKHKVVMTMPDPIMLEYFYNKSSSTTYWGAVYDRTLDFNNTEDQVLAYKWYIDYVRKQWAAADPQNLELAGFYVLSEILVAKPSGWNYKYKRWDKILPEVSEYLHEMQYGLYWIPYYQADGYDMTRELGIDYTWLQPNKYWDYPEKEQKKNWSWVFGSMGTYGHGMEIEFEGSHGEAGWSQWEEGVARTSSSILETVRTDYDAQGTAKGKKNPQAARNKALLRDYMNEMKKSGYYGTARIATYSGTNGMWELATSTDVPDREMYLEYCKFIVENPLRK